MSPAIQRELDGVREAAEYAASHPLKGGESIQTIRGYVRHNGRWYVEALREDDPEPLVLDGSALVEIVNQTRQGVSNDADEGDAVSPADGEPARESGRDTNPG